MKKKNFLNHWEKNKLKLIENNIYSENDEHSSCGVGLIASISGESKLGPFSQLAVNKIAITKNFHKFISKDALFRAQI